MMQYAKMFNVFVIYFIVVCMMWPVKIDGQGAQQIKQEKPLMCKCDIVLIIDEGARPGSHSFHRKIIKQVEGVVQQFPDYFLMGEDHTRAAIVRFASVSEVRLHLTADDRLVRSSKIPYFGGERATVLGLRAAREEVFVYARPNAMRIVILITTRMHYGWKLTKEMAEKEAKLLQNEGTRIYVVYIGEQYHTNPEVKPFIKNVAGDPSNIFLIEDYDKLTPDIYWKIGNAIKCEYQPGCRFHDSSLQTCVGGYWRPCWRPMIDDVKCTKIPPARPPKIKCKLIDCEKMCNGWPWEEERECKEEDAGKNLTINREPQPKGNEQMFEHCLKEKLVKTCPPKTTEPPTTTESTTTTESPTTTEPPTTTESTTTTESPTTTEPPTTKESPKTTEPPTASKSSKTKKPPKTTKSLTESPPATEKAVVVETEPLSSVMTEWWVILLMVIIVLLILATIALVVIAVSRKRKKKAAAAAFMAKKKAAMEIPTSSDPPSMIEGRKRRPPGQPMEFSQSGSVIDNSVVDGKGRPRNRMVQFGYEKAAEADHSVQVSLAMDEKGRSPKKSGVKSASGKKAVMGSIRPIMKKSAGTKVSLAMDVKGRSPKKSVKSASGKKAEVKSISPVVKKSVDTKAAVPKSAQKK